MHPVEAQPDFDYSGRIALVRSVQFGIQERLAAAKSEIAHAAIGKCTMGNGRNLPVRFQKSCPW